MKNIVYFSLTMMVYLFVACSDDLNLPAENSIRFSVSFPDFKSEISTRTKLTGLNTTFVTGDSIGIIETLTGKYNVPFSYNGTSWNTSTPLYWYNSTSSHTFYGYYPYQSQTQGLSVAIPILSKQKVAISPDPACDMLVTPIPTPQKISDGGNVPLSMKHTFALLRFDIKMSILGLLNPYRLDSLIIIGGNTAGGASPYGMFNTANQISSVNYSFSTNAIQLTPNNSSNSIQSLSTSLSSVNVTGTAVSVYAYVLPGTYTNPAPAVRLYLSTLGLLPKNTGNLTLPNASTFTAGNIYVYQVSIGLNLLNL